MGTEIDFNKELNISYYDSNLPKPSNVLIWKHYFCSVLLYFFIYIILQSNAFFKTYFIDDLKICYVFAFLAYFFLAPIIYFTFRPKSIYVSHSINIFNYITRIIKNLLNYKEFAKLDYKGILNTFVPTYHEKQALMLIFIKVFFGILMVKTLHANWQHIIFKSSELKNIFLEIISNKNLEFSKNILIKNADFLFKFCITALFTVDVAVFAFGYLTELSIFKNKIKTVDTNIFGVLACLFCYNPFSTVSGNFIAMNRDETFVMLGDATSTFTWVIRGIALILLIIYVAASCALGTKASNLTNRGTVSRFPYNIVRHPAYISKVSFWFLAILSSLITCFTMPGATLIDSLIKFFLILFAYFSTVAIYFFRAITEERHLMQDPEYQEYAKKVKYRFIPYVF